ncbi:hypothetical protein VNO80_18536 [Phaseolus coccineus]|uniref:Uncharacterized protein n=1 Tax=Phaseolus coccineus TaxID=3886 RepID=A0AAN9MDZ6_PHACN
MLYIIYVDGHCLIILLHQDLAWTLWILMWTLMVNRHALCWQLKVPAFSSLQLLSFGKQWRGIIEVTNHFDGTVQCV